jgi:hypothetical protein
MKAIEFRQSMNAPYYYCKCITLDQYKFGTCNVDHSGTYVLASEANERIKVLEDALMRITYELGVPQPGYPQPVANAYDIAQAALEVKG